MSDMESAVNFCRDAKGKQGEEWWIYIWTIKDSNVLMTAIQVRLRY